MGGEHDLVDEPGRRLRCALEHRVVQPSRAVDADAKNTAKSKMMTGPEPPAHTRVISTPGTVVRVRWGSNAGLGVRVCVVHDSRVAREHEPCCSGVMELASMRCSCDVQRLSQHIGSVIRQPAGMSQSVASSVEQAVGASHGTTGSACKAAGQAADLQRLRSARRGLHREIDGRAELVTVNVVAKRLTSVLCSRCKSVFTFGKNT
jgi:hypothetical protein